jgi:hypothetical protein
MKPLRRQKLIATIIACALTVPAFAQTPTSLSIPDKVETALGTLEFKGG